MGRADGSDRLVSPEGADDAGTGILHVDMDAFYASVEVLDDPSLAGKPILVGAPEARSVVSSASYEARRYGVRSAMPVSQAVRLCPQVIVVLPHFERYREVSAQVMDIFRSITPLVEPLSIDEAFLDVRGARRLWGSPGEIARMVRRRVQSEIGITCSVGVAATKHVAKIASTLSKPDGLFIVPGAATERFLAPLSVRRIWGVGPRTAEVLEGRAIRTIADLRDTPAPVLERLVGRASAERLAALARGEDAREVETTRVEKSISHEETFTEDVADVDVLRAEVLRLADRVAVRLRRSELEAGGVALKLRYADFTTISRSQTLAEPTALGQRIGEVARELLASVGLRQPVR
ncbi:MAG: DNA polymerase IV, partial [Microbacterium sp.]